MTTTGRAAKEPAISEDGPRPPRRRAVAVAASVAAVTTAATVLVAGGGLNPGSVPGLPSTPTAWLAPAARLGLDLAATGTVGCLLGAAFLVPAERGRLAPAAYRLLQAAAWAAAAWALVAVAAMVFTLADLLGVPVGTVVSARSLFSYATGVSSGRAIAVTATVALVVAVAARRVLSPAGAAALLPFAVVGVLAPAVTGHAPAAVNHQLAVDAMILHVVPVTLWAGGLTALVLGRRQPADRLAVSVSRFSRLAGWCLVSAGASGVIGSAVRLGGTDTLLTTRYGLIVTAKVLAFACLGLLGRRHRRGTLAAVGQGRPGAFARLAAVEVVVFAATMGVAVGLSRTPAPITGVSIDVGGQDPAALLGYPVTAAPTLAALALRWLPQLLFFTAAAVAAVGYIAGVRRLRRRGHSWPVHRLVAWLAGCLVVVVATGGGLARYAPAWYPAHAAQHVALSVLAPLLLVLAAPVTLALRALAGGHEVFFGPRQWVRAALRSGPVRVATRPIVVAALLAAGLYLSYDSAAFTLMARSHVAHLSVQAGLLISGFLLFWTTVGVDPSPAGSSRRVRMALLAVATLGLVAFAAVLTADNTPVAADWFAALHRPWALPALSDQRAAAALVWAGGVLPVAVALGAVAVRGSRADAVTGPLRRR